eukprot:gb/GEZN01000646.1/.p1 GENE.gb/GEZN01000646.1/~~gb/GEZN01000646.1/.p1  ORF type:complete len:1141 (-),score=226.37 gb/GEZN01000646.1/:514-3714(-)
MMKPGPAGPLQVISPATLLSPNEPLQALFLYSTSIPKEFSKGSPSRFNSGNARIENCTAWLYGARIYTHEESGRGLVASPTGKAEDVLKGWVFTYPSGDFRDRLTLADKLHTYNPKRPGKGIWRRGEVTVVKEDGSLAAAYWYFQPEMIPTVPTIKSKKIITTKAGESASWESSVRLPASLRAWHYNVSISVDFNSFTFQGTVEIDLLVANATDIIVLHSKELDVPTLPTVSILEGGTVTHTEVVKEHYMYVKHEFLVIRPAKPLEKGNHVRLQIKFQGDLTDGLTGFYRSEYLDSSGRSRYIGTTQFQATDARKAFPCFDEPALKANFSISLLVPAGYHALSNMPVQYTKSQDAEHTWYVFQTSLQMSTYLVAWVVSDFKSVETSYLSTDGTHKQVRVWAPPGKEQWGQLAVDTAAKMMKHYEKYFRTPFPLPKQDMVGVPDFSMGAMENWGLVIYREALVLFQDSEQDALSKQRVAIVIAHELAHQWFGNLVTMAWWDGLWLNEGFASYMEYEGTAHVFPEWEMRTQFYDKTMAGALAFDGTTETHPILQQVDHPDQINELFDAISYSKGASLVRMMAGFLGEDVFLNGLSAYLHDFAYGNAETEDLWKHMATALKQSNPDSHIEVSQVMGRWATQAGFPLVTVKVDAQGGYILEQSRYYDDAESRSEATLTEMWDIPLNFRTVEDTCNVPPHRQIWLPYHKSALPTGQLLPAGLFKLNADQNAFIHMNYPNKQTLALQQAVKKQSPMLSQSDRAGLLNDAFAAFDAGEVSVLVPLRWVALLKYEPASSNTLWSILLKNLEKLNQRLNWDKAVYKKFLEFIHDTIGGAVKEVGWSRSDQDPHLQRLSRSSLKSAAIFYDIPEELKHARMLFQQFKQQGQSVEPDIRSAVYAAGLKQGGQEEFEMMWKRYQAEPNSAERQKSLFAMASVREEDLLDKLLNLAITPKEQGGIRTQDAVSAILQVNNNPNGQDNAWQFLKANWEEIFQVHGHTSFSFSNLIEGLLKGFHTLAQYREVQNFFQGRDMGAGQRALERALAKIEANIAWKERNWAPITKFLADWRAEIEN